MEEAGLDIRSQRSKGLSDIPLNQIDTVITLCGHARQYCPTVPGVVHRDHWPIQDPVGVRGTDEEVIRAFRTARDEIRLLVETFSKKLKDGQ